MHVLAATDGSLETEEAASFAASLADENSKVTVLTVVEIPRKMLQDLRDVMGEQHETGVIPGRRMGRYPGGSFSGTTELAGR